jgi:hypothetical protein
MKYIILVLCLFLSSCYQDEHFKIKCSNGINVVAIDYYQEGNMTSYTLENGKEYSLNNIACFVEKI